MRALCGLLALVLLSPSCARRYATSGMVLAVGPQRLTVSHRAIPGRMPAMTMTLPAASAAGLAPGAQIDFDLRIGKHGSRIENIRRRPAATGGLPLPPPPQTVKLGDRVPDFTLPSHTGEPVRLSSFAGSLVAVNFIYTRCPLPDVCPRLTAHFARLQRRFAGQPVRFLTITLDPRYDTPAVLADYARKWRADPAVWRFLSGTQDEVDRVAASFGMLYWPEAGQLVHTSSTGVLDATGRLVALIDGPAYDAGQLGDLIHRLLTGE